MQQEAKIRIGNEAGRDFGSYPGATNKEAAEAYAVANGYSSIEEAEGLLFRFGSLVFVPEDEEKTN